MGSVKGLADRIAQAQLKYNIFTSIRTQSQREAQIRTPTNTVAIKDNIVTIEEPTTCSSHILSNYTSPFEATVVTQVKELGSQIVGKTNLDEFGMGSGCTKSYFGPTLNPLYPDIKKVAGGSSGGSAAAVAAGVADYALGTDTGGSVRLPAAYTGIYGFKPSYGRISRWGVIAYAQSLDTVGILAKDINLLDTVHNHLDKYDSKDPTSLSQHLRDKVINLENQQKESKLKIGITEELLVKNLSAEVSEGFKNILSSLAKISEIVPISVPSLKYALPAYYTLASAEAASNLSRFDGIRYGFRSDSDKNNYSKTRSLGFGKEVKNRILLGNFNLNSSSYNNHFLKAKALRSQLRSEFDQVFKFANVWTGNEPNEDGVDILISPVSITPAPTLAQYELQTSAQVYTNDVLTVPVSLAGLPAISIPWKVNHDSLPIGIQLIGQFGNDKKVLQIAKLLSHESGHISL